MPPDWQPVVRWLLQATALAGTAWTLHWAVRRRGRIARVSGAAAVRRAEKAGE